MDVPPGDVLVHAGDMTMGGHEKEIWHVKKIFREYLNEGRFKRIVFIAGNHDFLFQNDPKLARKVLNVGDYLFESGVEIEGVKFWGTPHQPWFYNWAFNMPKDLDEGADYARRLWASIPEDTDVLVTHSPPWSRLDANIRDIRCGCPYLMERIKTGLPNLKLHVFGHIHEGYGETWMWRPDGSKLTFINASQLDLEYEATNRPIIFDL